MAHSQAPQTIATQERQNRKLIEHIHEQKKRLQHGHPSSMSSNPAPILAPPSAVVPGLLGPDYINIIQTQQRTALQFAHVNSVGYFIPQDSPFGNLILPVLPRITDSKNEIK